MKYMWDRHKKPVLVILTMVILWKLLMLGVGYFGSYKIGIGPNDTWSKAPTVGLLKHTFKWDTGWYVGIAEQGYAVSKSAPVFYPLFPFILYTGKAITGFDFGVVALLLNTLAGFCAAVFLFLIVKDLLLDDKTAYFAVIAFLIFPTSYFLHAMYGEAVFCALSFAAYYFARKKRWLLSGILLGLLTASRLPGLLVVLLVAVEYLEQKQFDFRRIKKDFLFLLLGPMGIVIYSLYLWRIFGDPIAMFHAYNYGEWAYQKLNLNIFTSAWVALKDSARLLVKRPSGWQSLFFDLTTPLWAWLSLSAFSVVSVYKKIPVSLTIYLASSFLLLGIHSTFVSSQRYLLVIFPIYIVIAKLAGNRSEYVRLAYVAVSSVLMAFLYLQFVNGIWTA